MQKYNHKKQEKKWQEEWAKSGIYKIGESKNKPKYYVLDMFPYPSGAGLHVGHPRGYIATDVVARFKMLNGFNVLHPMGFDAFGLPAENYALKTKIHPKVATKKNIKRFKEQLEILGLTYDWDREINTTDPKYYKWTQWIFLQMFKKGLAYESYEPINWCPSCQTGLANEDLEEGKCERCGSEIEQKPIRQWVLRITDYAEELLDGLRALDWEDSIIEMQRNWIGKSEGAEIEFRIVNCEFRIKVFTTRPDTLFGCTYIVVCPEHELLKNNELGIRNYEEVKKYIRQTKKKSVIERTDLNKDKTGVELKGIKAVNPVNNKEIPIFAADYVLAGVGTGAIMAVPAHDGRDFEFAKMYNLSITTVVAPDNTKTSACAEAFSRPEGSPRHEIQTCHSINSIYNDKKVVKSKSGAEPAEGFEPSDHKVTSLDPRHAAGKSVPNLLYHIQTTKDFKCFSSEGININSDFLNGLKTKKAKEKIIKWLEEKNLGKRTINYKLQDWVFSRQRYWGEPIPLIHCGQCGVVPVLEKDLPVELPDVKNYKPTGTGESPLANIKEWVNTKCPKCEGMAKRETNTMPQWAGSSWYYLRYIDPKNNKKLVDSKKEKYWMAPARPRSPGGVDLYIGGAEHATRHLIYARFWHKFLFNIGAVSTSEPFEKLQHVGLIQSEDGRKMSKRWGNVINPDEIVKKHGADSMRVYEMFMGPFENAIAWSTDGLMGSKRFLEKVWRIVQKKKLVKCGGCENAPEGLPRMLHKTIKKVGEDIQDLRFNTAISQMMIFINFADKFKTLPRPVMEKFLILLAPFAPHIAEELWAQLGNKKSIFKANWPEYDKRIVKDETINLVIQVNGKLRDTVKASADITEEEAKKIALESEKIKKWTEGKKILKVIFVKGKLINIVIAI